MSMSVQIKTRPRAVVLGLMSTMPFGGVIWQTLHYLVGLERLGYETYYVEAHERTPRHFIRHPGDDGATAAAAYIDKILGRFGFASRWAYQAGPDDDASYGLSRTRLRELYAQADFIVNLHGGTVPRPEHVAAERLVCVVTDPVQLEMELRQGVATSVRFFHAHSACFTFGENLGQPDCLVPCDPQFPMQPTRQPVVLDFWSGGDDGVRDTFTTIANWFQPWRHVEFGGETYRWSKHLEFLKVVDLPSRTRQPLELALSRCSDEHRRQLLDNGWRLRDALDVSTDPEVYRRYVTTSRAEFTVAKDQNIRLRSGWFSDRSATYLAAGRPVVTQDTAFGNVLPTGEGLFAFSTAEEAAAAIDAINRDYTRHARAAREIAREYFGHDVVLGSLLESIGLEHRQRRRKTSAYGGLTTMLVAHRYPPDATGGVERYTEQLAARLVRSGDAVHVLARSPGSGPLRREVERLDNGVIVHRVKGGKVRRRRFLSDRTAFERLFREAIGEADPDLIHFNHVLDLSPSFLMIAKDRGAAVVLTLHDYYFACPRIVLRTTQEESCGGPQGGRECARTCFSADEPLRPHRWALRAMYFRRLLDLADRIVCPSPNAAEFFASFGADVERLEVVANGIWIARADAQRDLAAGVFLKQRDRNRLALAFMGAVLPHKGLKVLLRALEEARLGAVDLVAFGPAGDRIYAREMYALACGIPGLNFRIYGAYEPEDLPLLLEDVDCVVVPSLWPETFCLVAREALARGVPVVAAQAGALADDVIDGNNGFVFQPERIDQLAAILRRLDGEPGLLARLRSGALATRISTMDDHVKTLRGSYGAALRRAARARRVPRQDRDDLLALQQMLESCGFAVEAVPRGSEADLPTATFAPPQPAETSGNEHDRAEEV
jgi:glycosyltransferase involved in cell wall biosynthesis